MEWNLGIEGLHTGGSQSGRVCLRLNLPRPELLGPELLGPETRGFDTQGPAWPRPEVLLPPVFFLATDAKPWPGLEAGGEQSRCLCGVVSIPGLVHRAVAGGRQAAGAQSCTWAWGTRDCGAGGTPGI